MTHEEESPPEIGGAKLIELVARGWTDDRIARTLGVSRTTVQRRLHSLSRELGAVSRVTLVVRALQEGVVDISELHQWEVERLSHAQ